MQTAIQLDPYPRGDWLLTLLSSSYLEGRYADVLALSKRYVGEIKGEPSYLPFVAAAQAMLGNDAEVRAMADQVRRLAPFFRMADYVQVFGTPRTEAALREGLTRAGFD